MPARPLVCLFIRPLVCLYARLPSQPGALAEPAPSSTSSRLVASDAQRANRWAPKALGTKLGRVVINFIIPLSELARQTQASKPA